MANILVVDDEKEIAQLIEVHLELEHHNVIKYLDPRSIDEKILGDIDVAILDIMMPGIDGLTLCYQLREKGYIFPIIMLTAKDSDIDVINGLAFGADDYIKKPFNPMELLARINAQLRRLQRFSASENNNPSTLYFNGLSMDEETHQCYLYKKQVMLTPIEFSILYLLMKNQKKVVSSEEIFESIWKQKYLESNNTVMTHVQNIRKKLNDIGKDRKFIQTIWGVGYKLDDKI